MLIALNQCVQFSINTQLMHKIPVRWVENYLASAYIYMDLSGVTRCLYTCGVTYKPNKEKCMEFYVDSTFYGRWSQAGSDNTDKVMLRT